jgi:2-alkyl-3-oxoalkanoate reductase
MTLRLAVTGASGFIGGAVTRAATGAGHEVHAFGRRPAIDPGHVGGARYRSWDITAGPLADPPDVDAVIHCAGSVTDFGTWKEMEAANHIGTQTVRTTFQRVDRFVHVSTASVYDPRVPTVLAGERDTLHSSRHLEPYGRSKALAEEMFAERYPEVTVIRPHAVYGPGDTTLLPRLLDAVRNTPRGPRLFAVGDGRQKVSLTSIDNLVQACLLAARADAVSGFFNVADAEPVVLDDALRAFLTARGSAAVPLYLPFRVAYAAAALAEARAIAVRRIRVSKGAKPPRLTRYAVRHLSVERTLDITAARELLGYLPAPTSFEGAADW